MGVRGQEKTNVLAQAERRPAFLCHFVLFRPSVASRVLVANALTRECVCVGGVSIHWRVCIWCTQVHTHVHGIHTSCSHKFSQSLQEHAHRQVTTNFKSIFHLIVIKLINMAKGSVK